MNNHLLGVFIGVVIIYAILGVGELIDKIKNNRR